MIGRKVVSRRPGFLTIGMLDHWNHKIHLACVHILDLVISGPSIQHHIIMSKFTSSREGFGQYLTQAVTGPADETKAFVESAVTPDFYTVVNDKRSSYSGFVEHLAEMRPKVSEAKADV